MRGHVPSSPPSTKMPLFDGSDPGPNPDQASQEVALTGAAEADGADAVEAEATAPPAAVPALLLLETPPAPPVLLSSLTSICREPSSVPLSSWMAAWASSCSPEEIRSDQIKIRRSDNQIKIGQSGFFFFFLSSFVDTEHPNARNDRGNDKKKRREKEKKRKGEASNNQKKGRGTEEEQKRLCERERVFFSSFFLRQKRQSGHRADRNQGKM